MKKLIRGIVEFRARRLAEYREKFSRLALGQSPDTLFIACSDSRVVPNLFASTDPGDLFVMRNVGNLIPPCRADGFSGGDVSEWAAIEFAVLKLGVSDIVVCGHSECGAVQAVLAGRANVEGEHLKDWLACAERAANLLPGIEFPPSLADHNRLSQANVLLQLEHLKTYPLVRRRMEEGALKLHGWWFDIATGDVFRFAPASRRFELIDG